MLLSATPTPAYERAKPMSLLAAFRFSPLSAVGTFFAGAVFAAQFGMTAVYGTEAGLTTPQIAVFVSVFYIGGLLFQFPVGWIADRTDRRLLILVLAFCGGLSAIGALVFSDVFPVLLVTSFLIGGFSNPLYPLLIAYMNDYLETDDMAAGSGALLFLNGLGAVLGPVLAGYMMDIIGPEMFWAFLAAMLLILSGYALWRMRQRPAASPVEENVSYVPISPISTTVALEAAQEQYVENAELAEETA